MNSQGNRAASLPEWQAYLTNRARRARDGRFLVQGRRPITVALAQGWPLETLLYRLGVPELSDWARELLDSSGIPSIGLLPEVIGALSGPDGGAADIVAVACSRAVDLTDFDPPGPAPVIVVLDRPTAAEALGLAIRNAAAFGAAAVVVSGPAADHLDPRCVLASAGAQFAVPVYRVSDPGAVLAFRDRQWLRGLLLRTVGVGVDGVDIADHRFAGHAVEEVPGVEPIRTGTILVVSHAESGPGPAWRAACETVVRLPVGIGSLDATSSVAVALYEINRQRLLGWGYGVHQGARDRE